MAGTSRLVDKRRDRIFNIYRHLPALGKGSDVSAPLQHEQLRSRKRWTEVLHEVFLPEGYPQSVSKDYARYQFFDSLQAFCSSITGLLAHRAILQGVGVGNELATATSAIFQWAIRDGTGMLSRVGFAWATGSDLDVNSKTWRYAADVLNDLAMSLEMLTIHLPPHFFLPSICTASVLRALVGVAGGATRASLTEHQALRGNMADVSAKDGSQETAVALLGMLVGIALAPVESLMWLWLLFALATFVHLLANYLAVSSVVLTTFNPQRLHLVVDHHARTGQWLSPEQAAARESIFTRLTLFGKLFSQVKFGVPIHDLQLTTAQLAELASPSPTSLQAIIAPLRRDSGFARRTPRAVGVALAQRVTEPFTQIRIYLQAYGDVSPEQAERDLRQLESHGWSTSQHKLGLSEWRFDITDMASS